MKKSTQFATVKIWGQVVGVVVWDAKKECAFFEFDPLFLDKKLDLSPILMPINVSKNKVYSFPTLKKETYWGLPGLLADALPDKFGNTLINAWLAQKGRDQASFTPIERLCYIGKRGMGALEFEPSIKGDITKSVEIQLSDLVDLAQQATSHKKGLQGILGHTEAETKKVMRTILSVGTSAGGARAKAVIAMNDQGDIKSGQSDVDATYTHWILKFDGINDLELGQVKSYGRIEYAYYLMAKDSGIEMSECNLIKENGRAHFITKRFDRIGNEKIHMQSLCGIAHFDYNVSGAYSYEQAFQVMRSLHLSKASQAQFFKRLVFNVVAKNLDDHTKNIAFLMDKSGKWHLSPGFDITYAHNPKGLWTNKHQMTINGKRDTITREDLKALATSVEVSHSDTIIDEVIASVKKWPQFSNQAELSKEISKEIARHHHLAI